MRRTTLTIEDDHFRRLKALAGNQGKSLAALVNELLRQALAVGPRRPPYSLDLEGWEAEAQPGVDILDRDKLFDLMNGR
jgi:hypothetical protein